MSAYSLAETNLFAYCCNNPVNLTDNGGNLPSWATKVIIATGVVALVATVAAITVATAGAGTAVAMIAVGAAKGAAIGMVTGAAAGAGSAAANHLVTTGSLEGSKSAVLNGMGNGALTGAISGAITGGVNRLAQVVRNLKITNARNLPRTGKAFSSQSLVKNGRIEQTRYYNWRGNATWDIDFSTHSKPQVHSLPHAHRWWGAKRSGPINGFGWW